MILTKKNLDLFGFPEIVVFKSFHMYITALWSILSVPRVDLEFVVPLFFQLFCEMFVQF